MMGAGRYIETTIRAPLEEVWRHTQEPSLHEEWDLRFTSITYLTRSHDAEPQRFRYATRIGFGVEIAGTGESVTRSEAATGERTSSLRFDSNARHSLIREGAGYWRYIPTQNGVRFLTWYDYETRWGMVGRRVDRLLFRPLLGWATAWSFDRLRLRLERGIPPATALRQAVIAMLARSIVAFVFVYHGLVPKLLLRDPDERIPLENAGLSADLAANVVLAAGGLEIGFGILILVAWRQSWPLVVTIGLMVAALIGVAATAPAFLGRAFNPVTFNLAVAALAGIAWRAQRDAPSASRCRRRSPEKYS